jgi:hypothetical protein
MGHSVIEILLKESSEELEKWLYLLQELQRDATKYSYHVNLSEVKNWAKRGNMKPGIFGLLAEIQVFTYKPLRPQITLMQVSSIQGLDGRYTQTKDDFPYFFRVLQADWVCCKFLLDLKRV